MIRGFFNNYPYTDFHELNLDWILSIIRELQISMTSFVNINTIKYADPILWNITTQYEQNTLVQDSDGITYLSKQPVPAGVDITNTDYWLKVADFSQLADIIKRSITAADDGSNTTTSANRSEGDLLWLNNYLYRVVRPMNIGDAYVVGGINPNIEQVTIEQLLDELLTKGGIIKESIAAADDEDSTTSTANRAVGELVWLNERLYEVIATISIGDTYTVGTNVQLVTIEQILDGLRTDLDAIMPAVVTMVDSVRSSIAAANDGTSATSTANRAVGELVWVNDTLYEVTATITAGDAYTVGTNIQAVTVEQLIDNLRNEISTIIIPSLDGIRANIAAANDGDSATSTANRAVGDLVWLNGDLYMVISAITSGDPYVIGTNVQAETIEDYINTADNNLQNQINVIRFWKTPEMYGAVGDGVTDDTAAIQAMFNDCVNKDQVVFSASEYLISNTITISANWLVISGGWGLGDYGHRIKMLTPATQKTMFRVDGQGVAFKHIQIGGVEDNTKVNGIDFVGHGSLLDTDAYVDHCCLIYCNAGIRATGKNVQLHDNLFNHCDYGVYIYKSATDTEYRGYDICNNRIHRCRRGVYYGINTANTYNKQCIVRGNFCDYSDIMFYGYAGGVVIEGNMAYQTSDNAVIINGGTASDIECVITSNQFTGQSNANTDAIHITGNPGAFVVISNNQIAYYGRYGIKIDNGDVMVVANQIYGIPGKAIWGDASATGKMAFNVQKGTDGYDPGGITSVSNT